VVEGFAFHAAVALPKGGRGMTGHLDRYGEPIEDDLANVVPIRPRQTVRQHIAELRRILKDARDRREVDQ
jgi:hypothetical protein